MSALNNDSCSICFRDFNIPERGKVTVDISHSFCLECIATWFQTNIAHKCPLCREEIQIVRIHPNENPSPVADVQAAQAVLRNQRGIAILRAIQELNADHIIEKLENGPIFERDRDAALDAINAIEETDLSEAAETQMRNIKALIQGAKVVPNPVQIPQSPPQPHAVVPEDISLQQAVLYSAALIGGSGNIPIFQDSLDLDEEPYPILYDDAAMREMRDMLRQTARLLDNMNRNYR